MKLALDDSVFVVCVGVCGSVDTSGGGGCWFKTSWLELLKAAANYLFF